MDLRASIPVAAAGAPVSAAAFNALRDALIRLSEPRAGAGVSLGAGGGSLTLTGRARDPEYWLLARITEVLVAGPPDPEPFVESVSYSAQVIGRGAETRILSVVPRYGRLFAEGVRVIPAEVGDYCYIVRSVGVSELGRQTVTADLEVLTERLVVQACGGGVGASAGMAAMAPLPPPEPDINTIAPSGTGNVAPEGGEPGATP